ncbi:S8 family serine peptidase [Dactylosporangium sp. CA-233914]|uniref:S8 family serine peptidase n=1 Tax=Dactylosporangium sp. CA-233914 TaxID=3239934 RepID=UPI003D904FFC
MAFPMPAFADEVRDRQWHRGFLHVAEAYQISQGEGALVAVEDSGVDASAPELAGAVVPGKDLGGGRKDTNGHGTAVAGLIAGRGKSANRGIAPKAKILPVQVAEYLDFGVYPKDLAAGIDFAVSRGANVISIWLKTSDSKLVRTAIQHPLDADAVVVGAAGNKPQAGGVVFPANMPVSSPSAPSTRTATARPSPSPAAK